MILGMGRRLLAASNTEGGVFKLATPELLKAGNEIEAVFRNGLKKVAAAFGTGDLQVKSYRDVARLVFWFRVGGPGAKKNTPLKRNPSRPVGSM